VSRPLAFVLSREYPPVTVGGTSTVAHNLSVGLARNGWQVAVVTANPLARADQRDDAEGIIVHRTGTGVVYNEVTGLDSAVLASHRRLHRAATALAGQTGVPAVVLLPDLFCYPEAALFARAAGAPLVNVLLQDFRTLIQHDRDTHRVTTGVSASPAHLLGLEEKALRGSGHVVFISHALAAAMTGHYPDLGVRHSVIHLGVDQAEIASVAADDGERARLRATLPASAQDKPLLVACGRLVPVKGFAALLRALALFQPGDMTPHLALAGVGPEEPYLRALAAELGIAERVSFVGNRSRRTALTWMSAATVAVVPSLWESFCYVCAEMMALGRPVVATTVDSLSELIPSDRYGYRVPVAVGTGPRWIEPAALACAIRAALADPAEAAARGAAARRRIEGDFGNDRFARAMSELCAAVRRVGPDD
jgi:glycogen(starch) synthase